jgi:putative endonuclease
MSRKVLGDKGEDIAAEYLRSLGWEILERNWRCPSGELDIVAAEPSGGGTVVFCEVKTRRRVHGKLPVLPLEAVTERKVAKLRELALDWLRATECHVKHLRIDAVGVIIGSDGAPTVQHRRGIGA